MARLIIRADGNSKIGYGHVMRCLALMDGCFFDEVTWFTMDELSDLLSQNSSVPIDFKLLTNESYFFDFLKSTDFVLLDHYGFHIKDHMRIKQTGATLVLIDDLAIEPVEADIIINPSPGIVAQQYKASNTPIFLLGLAYALLRKPFLELAQKQQVNKDSGSIMICMGGADPTNRTATVLACCLEVGFSSIHVVFGGAYEHLNPDTLFKDPRVQQYRNLSAQEMAALMLKCEYGIYPASGILLEGLAAGQQIIAGLTAENQRKVYEGHLALHSVVDGGLLTEVDLKNAFHLLSNISKTKPLIDGLSIDRCWKVLQSSILFSKYKLRRVQASDLQITFEWASDPNVRRFALQQQEISLAEHTNWFEYKLNQASCFYYLLEEDERALGSIRFDLHEDIAQISYLLTPAAQGKGFGLLLLQKGMQYLLNEAQCPPFEIFLGEVLPANQRSIRIFEQLGFELENSTQLLRFKRKRLSNVTN